MALLSIFKSPVFVVIDAIAARLTKTGGGESWNAGAISRRFLPDLANNHGCRWKAVETTSSRMCGLSGNTDSSQSFQDIDFAWFALADGTLQIYETGILRTPEPRPNYAANELLEVMLEDLGDTRIFTDDFNDDSIDAEKWIIETPASPTVITESNGKLRFTLPTTSAGYNFLNGDALDFTGKSFVVDVSEFPFQSGLNDCGIKIELDANNYAILIASGGTGYFRVFNAGVQSGNTFGFDTGQISKMRIRHNQADGKFYFDTYTNSEGWRLHGSFVATFAVSAVVPRIFAGASNAYNPAGVFAIDNAKIESFAGSGFVVGYYRTPEGGARTLQMRSPKDDSFIRSLLPLRVDTSIYHENGTIDSIESIGANWQDESARSRFAIQNPTVEFDYYASALLSGGAGGGGEPSPTTGQIFPRGLN